MGTKFSCLTLQWVSSFASKYVWKNSGVRGLRLWPGGVSPEWKQQIVIRLLRFPLTSSYKHYLVSMELDQRIFGSLMRLFPSVMRPFNLISRWENREGESDFPSQSGAWWQVDWTLTCAFIWLQISCVPVIESLEGSTGVGLGFPGLKSDLCHSLSITSLTAYPRNGNVLRNRWEECAWHIVSTICSFLFPVRPEIFLYCTYYYYW